MNTKTILINRTEAVGDVIMTTPIIRKLWKDHNGDCRINYHTHHYYSHVLKNNPYLNAIVERRPTEEEIKNCDLYIDLDLAYEKQPHIHAINALALHVFGHDDFDKTVDLFTVPKDKLIAEKFSRLVSKNYIVVHGRQWTGPNRNIPFEFWETCIEYIAANSDVDILFIGLYNDVFVNTMRSIDIRNRYSIQELKEIIANSKCYLGTDSGPAHVASSTDVPMVILYTNVKADYRYPLRANSKFQGIASDIECYGCQANYPAPFTFWACARGDLDCVNRFDPIRVANNTLDFLKNNL